MDVYTVGLGETHQTPSAEVLGGKGAGLVWMSNHGVPVPPGFILPTTVWADYDKKPKTTLKAIAKALPTYLAQLDAHYGYRPLVSVRSGARVSCPGMMDTILNVGIDTATAETWKTRLGEACFENSLHRLVMMYGSVVKNIRKSTLEPSLDVALAEYTAQTGEAFPNAEAQLLGAIEAVFKSWDNDRAKFYRKQNQIPREWGTAVTVQAMVFGNLDETSGTGVLFTRNPNTGASFLTGEFLPSAQGEDVVDGSRTPLSLDALKVWNLKVYGELADWAFKLEKLKEDVQDIEFTIEHGTLYLLQTRDAKRSATAALKIALDLVTEGIVDAATALSRVSARQYDQAQLAYLDPSFTTPAAFTGLSACSGVVSGKPVFTKEDALKCNVPCLLVRLDTAPEDIAGMHAAVGIITMVGGLTSHAAINAREMDKPCIVGVGLDTLEAFDVPVLSMDGATGRIWTEAVPIIQGQTNGLIAAFDQLVFQTLGVVPVVTTVPVAPRSEVLLYLGHQVVHPVKAALLVSETAAKVNRLYLDLTPTPGSAEALYLDLVKTYRPAQKVLDLLVTDPTLLGKLVVLDTDLTHPYATVPVGTDLRAVILADQELLVDGLDMTDPAVQKVLDWKTAEGLALVSVGAYAPTTKSMLSLEQALGMVLKGV